MNSLKYLMCFPHHNYTQSNKFSSHFFRPVHIIIIIIQNVSNFHVYIPQLIICTSHHAAIESIACGSSSIMFLLISISYKMNVSFSSSNEAHQHHEIMKFHRIKPKTFFCSFLGSVSLSSDTHINSFFWLN